MPVTLAARKLGRNALLGYRRLRSWRAGRIGNDRSHHPRRRYRLEVAPVRLGDHRWRPFGGSSNL
jgi:hypothetical protein